MIKKGASHLDMLNGPIAIKMIWFALPVALSALFQQMLNATDIAVVGHFASSDAMAAVGANTFIINLMLNIFIGLSVGANVVIAQLIGQKDKENTNKAVHTTVLLSIFCGLFMSILGWFIARPVLTLLSTPDEILDLAVLYFRIYFLGMPFIILFNFESAILRSKGDTKRPLYVLIISGIFNVLLNLFLVVKCHLSVEGVAIATLVSSIISSLSLLYMLSKESPDLRIEIHKLKIHWNILKRIAYIGIPAGIQGMIFNFSNVMIQGGINSLGTAAVAANTASLNFDYFCFFIGNAFGQAGTSFMSQNYGAKQIDRCKRVVRNSMIIGPVTVLIVSSIFILFANQLASFFTSDPEVIRLAVIRSQIVLAIYSIHSFNEIMSGILRSLGYAIIPAWINIIFICGVRLIWLFFVFPMKPEMGFLMYCYPISWIVNVSILMPVFFVLVHRSIWKARTLEKC